MYRTVLATALLALVFAFVPACGGVSQRSDKGAPAPPAIAPALSAFERDPNRATWETLHVSLIKAPIAPDSESRLVEVLATKPVSRAVLAAAAVDLATLDWGGTMQWLQKLNVAARSDTSRQSAEVIANTSRLAWLMLTLRANYADDSVDLTRTNLKAGTPSTGQAMNLARVDFSDAELAGADWRSSNLTDALFNGTVVAGVLRCTNCTFGTLRYRGTAVLTDGKWVSR